MKLINNAKLAIKRRKLNRELKNVNERLQELILCHNLGIRLAPIVYDTELSNLLAKKAEIKFNIMDTYNR